MDHAVGASSGTHEPNLRLTPCCQVMSLVFTHERWDNHRSTLRYAKHLLYMFNSNMFKARSQALAWSLVAEWATDRPCCAIAL